MTQRRRIFARFTGKEILLEQGRLLFSLLHALVRGGYEISLFDNQPLETLGKYGALARGLEGISFTASLPSEPQECILLFDRPERRVSTLAWQAKWRVAYDLFSPYWFTDPIVMPFPMHPLQAMISSRQLANYRTTARRMRIFFSGDTTGYTHSRVRYPKPKLPRLDIVQTIVERLGESVTILKDPDILKDPSHAGFLAKCVIADPQSAWITPEDWLPTLALSDFFLSPPGIVMPMCHNIVEAMAVGTIPITNYPEWFVPPLDHMRNCIAFHDHDDLIAKLRLALDFPPRDLARMRDNVAAYYETTLRPENFVKKIEARSAANMTLLMYTERNTALHAERLGRHSVLFRDMHTAGKPGLPRLLTAAFSSCRARALMGTNCMSRHD